MTAKLPPYSSVSAGTPPGDTVDPVENTKQREEAFSAFRQKVVTLPGVLAELQRAPDPEGFIALALQHGAAHGLEFSPAEIQAALRTERQRWLERNLS